MNNDIEEDYVSFEIAKLLKEKGFDCETNDKYTLMYPNGIQVGMEFHSKDFDNELVRTFVKVKMPTQSLAIKWIKENFKIYVDIIFKSEDFALFGETTEIFWDYWIFYPLSKHEEVSGTEFYDSPEKATDAALLYILQNFIEP